ncbi:CPCC family cysteine-rich protein [Xenorhabdus sp. PB62.4]|uniref:CPCC family cysteine-rich protein n=1 Tax=Xenorhabdus sp. PB62.4 TaxID=1851573 RepID=UPI001656C725|nr:CPCC family cysteine-rich protein [Xenorhabdus sp. PB62.4]MBC8954502.1 hydrolase [Xenorhabdus sp. PB62.4]
MDDKYHCPCCNHTALDELGKYLICDICGWEDDPVQSKNADFQGGANEMSLNEARKAFSEGKKII